jgi:hypothetical protein
VTAKRGASALKKVPRAAESRWSVALQCPNCGCDELRHLTGSRPSRVVNRESSAIAQCVDCEREWKLTVTLNGVTESGERGWANGGLKDSTNACGEPKGYRQHTYHGEEPCDDCRKAFNKKRRDERAAKKEAA